MTKQVRFWHYGSETPVLIKIRAGQVLHHSHGGATDEGWHRDSYRWEFDGQFLRREHVSDGCDCDGRLTQCWESLCHASQVAAGIEDSETAGIVYPAWKDGDSSPARL